MKVFAPFLLLILFLFSYKTQTAKTDEKFGVSEDSLVLEQDSSSSAETDFLYQPAEIEETEIVQIRDIRVKPINNRGVSTLIIEAIDESGKTDTHVNGSYLFTLNGESDTPLEFSKGFSIFKLGEEKVQPFFLYHEGANGKISKLSYFRLSKRKIKESKIPLWTSILPPLIAIGLALLIKEVIISLFLGVMAGSWLIWGMSFRPGDLFSTLTDVFEIYILGTLTDTGHLSVIIFSLMIGGIVALISRNGGMAGVVLKLSRFARNSRSTQLVTWFLGMAIFFDDYANTLIVGNTMKPVTDRYRISREKLAYIVDSTAAPVAAIAFVTTWIGAELGYISGAIEDIGVDHSAYSVFLNSLKYSFYPVFTLLFMFMIIWMRRDFGGMRKAELRARESGEVYKKYREDEGPVDDPLKALEPVPGVKLRWYNAFIPILTIIVVTIGGLMQTGYDLDLWVNSPTVVRHLIAFEQAGFLGKIPAGFDLVFTTNFVSDVIGNADSYTALVWASTIGIVVALLLTFITRSLSLRDSIESIMDGFKTMLPAICILILAWALADITKYLHTADFLTSAFSDSLQPSWMPFITFIFAALISFSTGSSWSTMAILYPLLLPLTWSIGVEAGWTDAEILPIFYNVTATVLAGSVFGDHCSPISDTTILSSLATSCNHIDHVKTQLPYAMSVGLVSIFIGGVFTLIGLPFYLDFIVGFILLFLVVRFIGKPVPETHISEDARSVEVEL